MIEKFHICIPLLINERLVRVYQPEDYPVHVGKRYPVLYMHDGHHAVCSLLEMLRSISVSIFASISSGISHLISGGVDNVSFAYVQPDNTSIDPRNMSSFLFMLCPP